MGREVSPWEVFVKDKPEVAEAYQELMRRINKNNVLDRKTTALIYVGIYSTLREGGALRHFAGEALKAGATKEEVEAAALLSFGVGVSSAELSIPTILNLTKDTK